MYKHKYIAVYVVFGSSLLGLHKDGASVLRVMSLIRVVGGS